MITNSIKSVATALVLLAGTTGCAGWLAQRCLQRQHRGAVFSLDGEVAAGGVAVHEVLYGTEGSQNNIRISWPAQRDPRGSRLRVIATRTECMVASEVDTSGSTWWSPGKVAPPCATVGHQTGFSVEGEFVQAGLTITNGRGNPDALGSPAKYKLWIFGDPDESVRYHIDSSYFYGPDC